MEDQSFYDLAEEWLGELNEAIDAVGVDIDSPESQQLPQFREMRSPVLVLALTRQSLTLKCRWPVLAAALVPIAARLFF